MLADGAGGLIVVWEEQRSSPTVDLFATRILFDGSVAPGWPSDGIAVSVAPGHQRAPWIASDSQGGLFVTWEDLRTEPPNATLDEPYIDVYAHHILATGSMDPRWPVNGLPVCVQPSAQQEIFDCGDGAGGVYVAWTDYRFGADDIYVQHLNADGSIVPGWTLNGSYAGGDPGYDYHLAPPIPDGVGGVLLTWETESGQHHVLTQHLTASGTPASGWQAAGNALVAISGGQLTPWIISDGYGGAIEAWADTRLCGSCDQTYALRILGDGPTAVAVSLISATAEPGIVRLAWSIATSTPGGPVTLERRGETGAFATVATLRPDGTGQLSYEDHIDEPGRYTYRLVYSDEGTAHTTPDVSLDVPSAYVLALAGFTPNPASGEVSVAFTLPKRAAGSLAIYDVMGRELAREDLSNEGAGPHNLRFGSMQHAPAGMYWIRLRHDAKTLTRRGVVIR
jgi:hypothetical protein